MLRSMLVVLDGSPSSEPVIALAFDWATRFRARLLGLGVLDEPSIEHGEPVPMGAYAYKKHRDEVRLVRCDVVLPASTLQTFVLLGLAGGEEIDVVTVHRDSAEAEATALRAGDFLTAHGVPHQLHAIASKDAPADVLLDTVERRRPRLLVMGAHAPHPVRDLFATSVTRAVLAACPVPVVVGV